MTGYEVRDEGLLKVNTRKQNKKAKCERPWLGRMGWEGASLAIKRLTCLTQLGNREEGDPQ